TASLMAGLTLGTGGLVSQASSTVVGDFHATGVITGSSTMLVSGLSRFLAGTIHNASSTVEGNLVVTGPITGSSTIITGGSIYASSTLAVTGNTVFHGNVDLGDGVADGVTMKAGTTTITSNKASAIATNAHAIATTTVAGEPGFLVFDTSPNYRIGVGTSSPSSTFSVGGAGTLMVGANNTSTSTVVVDGRWKTATNGTGGCINMRSSTDGSMYRIYVWTDTVNTASSSLRVELGLCQ
ncbi:MAG: hypothetical protein Q8R30_02445, partial [bacterium]|nr:hypothetical protein [bacterium]